MEKDDPVPGGSGTTTPSKKKEKIWYQQAFNNEWLKDPEFKGWLKADADNRYVAICTVCESKLKNCNKSALMQHKNSAKHIKNFKANESSVNIHSFFKKSSERDSESEVSKAELLLTGFIAEHSVPFRQADHLVEVIKEMFPDSDKAQKISLKRTKVSYLLQDGTAWEEEVVPVHQDGAISPTPSSKELIIPASIGFIGCGNMAQSLMNAFFAKGLVEPHLMMASAPSHRNLSKVPHGMRTTNDNNQVVRDCDIIFICVKPHMLPEMIEGLDPLERDHNPLFVSVVTGFDLNTLEQMLGSLVDSPRVIRIMPNTPCMIGQGCCVYTMGTNTNDSDNKVIHSMLHSVGYCAKVPEYQMDAACGLAGSGPAYIYAAIEALADGGVKMGLPRPLSQSLAAHVVKGAASMVLETGKHPAQLKDEVCSPAGTTITAMHSLEKNGFRNALISAVEASASRSKELGEKH